MLIWWQGCDMLWTFKLIPRRHFGLGETSIAAMTAESCTSSVACPVVREWVKVEHLITAASKGKLTVARGKLTRLTCVDNRELLIPLIKEFGTLKQFSCLFQKWNRNNVWSLFFFCRGSVSLPRYEAEHSHDRGRCFQISSLCSAQGIPIADRHLNNITLIGRSEQINLFLSCFRFNL